MSDPHAWLVAEDEACRNQRAERLAWLVESYPQAASGLLVHGGWLSHQLLEEAKYCFAYGQFIATTILGYALAERLLASELYARGRNDLERARSETLLDGARQNHMITDEEFSLLDKLRALRNPLVHFRRPFGDGTLEDRWRQEQREPEQLLESDARSVLSIVFNLLARHAV